MGSRLKEKVAFITGAASGMGAAQAVLFAREGASVCVADIDEEKGNVVVGAIRAGGGKAFFSRLDVTDEGQWAADMETAAETFGSVNVLCNNAGVNIRVSFEATTVETWRKVMDTNLLGSFLGIKAAVAQMRQAGGGAIINMGSAAIARSGAGQPAYGASKAGLLALTQTAAAAFAADNIRCNLVSPGHVDTPFIRGNAAHSPNDWTTSIDNPENYQRRLASTPLGRLQTPEDVAWSFLFLASDEASEITGAHLKVDGGCTV